MWYFHSLLMFLNQQDLPELIGYSMAEGKKNVKRDISSGEKNTASLKSAKRSFASSVLEFKLDELRKEVSSIHVGENHWEIEDWKYGSRILEQIEKYRDCVLGSQNRGTKQRKTKKDLVLIESSDGEA